MHYLLDDTNPIIVKMFDTYMERINRLIKSGGALSTGLRKFEIFLFDRETYEEVISEKSAPEAKKFMIADLFKQG